MAWEQDYREVLHRARLVFAKRAVVADESLVLVLAQAISALWDMPDELRGIVQVITTLGVDLERVLLSALRDTVVAQAEAHRLAYEQAVQQTGVQATGSFQNVPKRALEGLMVRRGLSPDLTFRTLINRRIQHLKRDVEDIVTRSLAQGTSSETAARQLARLLANGDQNVLTVLKQGIRTSLRDESVSVSDIKSAKSLLSDSRRIMRTELNTAFLEVNRAASVESPVIRAVKWNLSGSHKKADVCDMLASADAHGLGEGVYFAETMPSRPHPHCACFLTYILRPPSEWNTPKDAPSKPNEVNDKVLNAMIETDTPAFKEAQKALFRERIRLGYEVWRGE